ncbi:MAG TPA: hypothetical protein PLU30_18785 [Verrucomicrobiae bacterium]|nr:hypothetical protein [Verrucomicrobiae bacterium]
MVNPFSIGFVAVFEEPLGEVLLRYIVDLWLERYEGLEQVLERDVATTRVGGAGEVRWEKNLQFRVLNGDEFAWVYVTQDSRVMETTGMPGGGEASLCLELLVDLPGLKEVVADHDEARLSELEGEGLL